MKAFFLLGLFVALCGQSLAAVVLVDFGSPALTASGHWNNVTYSGADAPFAHLNLNLIDDTGASTDFKLNTVSTLLSSNTSGATSTSTGYPNSATCDSFFINASNTITLTFTNLNPALAYNFDFYASRMSAGEARITKYQVAGGNKTESTTLNASDNVDTIASLSGFTPNSSGEIQIVVSRQSGSYGYLGVVRMTTTTPPPPPTNAQTISVDFGSPLLTTANNWNNVFYNGADAPFANLNLNLIDSTGAATGFKLDTVSTLLSSNTSGATSTSTGYPNSATCDSFFITTNNTITLTLSDLNPALLYSFDFYASRMGASEARITRYEVAGGNKTENTSLNASDNTNTVASLTGFTPNANGKITVTVSRTAGDFGYLGVMQMKTTSTSGTTSLVSPNFIDQQALGLHPNPGFENGATGWLNNHRTSTPAEVANGSYSAYNGGVGWYLNLDITSPSTMPAVAGKYYRLVSTIASENNTVVGGPDITAACVDASGATLSETYLTEVPLQGTRPYKKLEKGFFAPPHTTAIKLRLRYGPSVGSKFFYDDTQVFRIDNLPVHAVPTYGSVSVYIARTTQPSGEKAHVFYRKVGQTTWTEAYPPIYDATRQEYRGSIVGLDENTTYEVQAVLETAGVVSQEAGTRVTTWNSNPPIAATHTVSSLYTSGEWKIENLHGSSNGWIKIVGTGTNDVDGGYVTTAGEDYGRAILIKNCDYLILENIHVKGGRFHGIEVRNSDNIRISRCEIEGWARTPNVVVNGISYESQTDATAKKPIDLDAAVFLHASNRVTVERCYMHDPRTGSHSQATYGTHPCGPNGIYVRNAGPHNGNHVIRYNDIIGGDQLRWNDAIEGFGNDQVYGSFGRDSDIHGNMLAMGSDDGIEFDGGQINLRFFGNRVESFYTGISVAPNMAGPSFIFRNLVTNLGDQVEGCWAMVKNGGGTTYSKGRTFFFHNTMVAACNGLAGVGYGTDAGDLRKMFIATSRNNIFYSTAGAVNYRNAISDTYPNAASDFDYDNLASATLTSAQVSYAAGQEAHGKLNAYPTFVNPAAGDFRLGTGSSAIDAGLPLANFSTSFAGAAPDQGAYEIGASSLMPLRPIAISADKYLVTLSAVPQGGTSTMVDVTLTTGNIGGPIAYAVRKNADASWLYVTPASGTLSNNASTVLTFGVNTAGLSSGQREAVVLVRLANGLSVPISITANVGN